MKTDLTGNYIINAEQPLAGTTIKYQIHGQLTVSSTHHVTGQMIFDLPKLKEDVADSSEIMNALQHPPNKKITLMVHGQVIEDYLLIQYSPLDASIMQLGCCMLMISDRSLVGKFIGYSPVNKQIITGELEFVKV